MTQANAELASLFENAESGTHVLWFRMGSRRKWEPVARTGSEAEAVNAIGCGGRRNGQWLVTPIGRNPN